MKKFNVNDEVYQAGKFGLRVALYVWKINRESDGTVTYTCSPAKGKDEQNYKATEIDYLGDLFYHQ